MKRWIIFVFASLFLLHSSLAGSVSRDPETLIGKPTPQLKVLEWLTPTPDVQGKWVIYEVWATWCPYCKQFVTGLNKIQTNLGSKVAIVALANEDTSLIRQFMQTNKVRYPVARMAEGAISDQFNVTIPGVPYVILYDPQGIVRWVGTPDYVGDSFIRWLERTVR